MNGTTRSLYVKMKTATGSEVWRNIAPSVKTGTSRINFASNTSSQNVSDLITAFVACQTEEIALDNNGEVQIKFVVETTDSYTSSTTLIPGQDSWTDTTDEKLLVNLTNGTQDGAAKIPHAATALGSGSTYESYEAAVSAFSQQLADHTTVGLSSSEWLNTHITGTKDQLVASPD